MTDAVTTARAFVDAVAWGEHHRVWELLGTEGRRTVLRVATGRGMDEAMAARLRDGTAPTADRERFLTDLVNGLRADFAGTDPDVLDYVDDPCPEPERVRVLLMAPMQAGLGSGEGLPVGSLELSDEGGTWRIQRLLPRPGMWPE